MAIWIVWLVMGVLLVLLSVGLLIPRVMLRAHAATLPLRDKAIGRLGEDGEGALYLPADSVRLILKNYAVARDEQGLYFRGEWAKTVAFAEYEITVYDRGNRILDILRVREKFNGGRFTHDTRLPAGADYITLRLICVDDTPVLPDPRPFNKQYAAWLAVLCLCLAVAADLLLWLGVTFLLNCLDDFTMTYRLSSSVWAALLAGTAAAVVVLTCAFSLGGFFLRRKRYLHEKR